MEKCAVCSIDAKQKCSGCSLVFYCTREHQVIDWKNGHKKNCKCYEIKSNDLLGRFMVARRDIKQGEVILKEKPVVLGPKTSSFPMCLGCNKILTLPKSGDFYKCSKCTWPMCGKSCENSPYHVAECKVMTARKFKSSIRNCGQLKGESSYCVIMPLRVILMRETNRKVFDEIMKLVSHLEQRRSTKLFEALRVNLVPFIINFLQVANVTERDILNIAGIFDTNCFEILHTAGKVKARGIYLETAMMAHNCVPNTKHFVDENFYMQVIATVGIKKDEMILTSYSHPLRTTIERRISLKSAKCFDCECARCKDKTEMKTFASCIKCSVCGKLVASFNPLDNLSEWQCEACDFKISGAQMIQMMNKFRSQLDGMDKKCVESCEKVLKEFEVMLSPNHVFIVDMKFALCMLYGNVKGYLFEDLSTAQIDRKYALCEEMIEILPIFEPGISNSVLNSKFEMAAVNIMRTRKQYVSMKLSRDDAERNFAGFMEEMRGIYEILNASTENKQLIAERFRRIKELIIL